MARASASVRGSSFLPFSSAASRAVNRLPWLLKVRSTFQYSSGTKASISFSRSSIRRTATLWTPARRQAPGGSSATEKGLSL